MSKTLINLTAHPITILGGDHHVEILPSGQVARVKFADKPIGYVHIGKNRVPLSKRVLSEVQSLPEPKKDVLYIVSSLVQNAVRDRDDLLTPFKTKRRMGHVVGCKHLLQL